MFSEKFPLLQFISEGARRLLILTPHRAIICRGFTLSETITAVKWAPISSQLYKQLICMRNFLYKGKWYFGKSCSFSLCANMIGKLNAF